MSDISEVHSYLNIQLGGKTIPLITADTITMFIITAILCISIVLMTRRMEAVPRGIQKGAEAFVEFMSNFGRNQIGHHYKPFIPYLSTLIIFILVSNMIGIFNVIPFVFQLHPPTKNINVTACLAILTIFVVLGTEFKYKGIKGWLKSFYKPTPVHGFVKILDYVIRPLSLCLRLFGNILGGYIVMALVYNALPIFLPVVIAGYFDLFDGALQAYVFVFLTALYLSEAVEPLEV